MVDEKEMKIGNWFHHNANWCYRRDENETKMKDFLFQWNDSDWYALGESTLFLENISPILITEEILLKCGFKYDGLYYSTDNYGVDVRSNQFFMKGKFGNDCPNIIYLCSCIYLHQLQIVFNLLNEEELIYKP